MHRSVQAAPSAAEPQLVGLWRANPYPGSTIALCNWLAGLGPAPYPCIAVERPEVVEFGRRAASLYVDRPGVLLAVGRMFLAWRDLTAALTTLVRAATLSKREPITYRLLGEVLLRRGDGRRALWVLERAVNLGMTDDDTRQWLEAARTYLDEPTGSPAER